MQCIQPQFVIRQTSTLLRINDIIQCLKSSLWYLLDPTAGPSATDHSKWYLDESSLHKNIKEMLLRFCGPTVFVSNECDMIAFVLATTAPPTAAEW